MMFSVPLLNLTTYKSENNSFSFGLNLINSFAENSAGYNTTYNSYIEEHDSIRTPLVWLTSYDVVWDKDNYDITDLRGTEYELATDDSSNLIAIFDIWKNTKLEAGLNLVRTCFICVVLAGGAILFSKDTNRLVITPIEKMIDKVKRIAKNPLEAMNEEENQAAEQEEARLGKKKKKNKNKKSPYETQILESTITKIGALLALGFGEAGARIIADNMKNSEATGDVDPMIPGKKVVCIFGFCDIRQFTDTTEVLQEDVMIFVNEIAELVHGIVD